MRGDEWEILEVAGAFRFTVSLVPTQWHNSQPEPVRATRDEHGCVTQIWWRNHQPAISIRDYCDDCLIRTDSSPWEFTLIETVWTDDNHHRIDLWESEHNVVAHIEIGIDARYPFVDFLARIVDFARRAKCLFYLSEDDEFVDASSTLIFEALNRSKAASLANRKKRISKVH